MCKQGKCQNQQAEVEADSQRDGSKLLHDYSCRDGSVTGGSRNYIRGSFNLVHSEFIADPFDSSEAMGFIGNRGLSADIS